MIASLRNILIHRCLSPYKTVWSRADERAQGCIQRFLYCANLPDSLAYVKRMDSRSYQSIERVLPARAYSDRMDAAE
jgi:hypothetical protein